MSDAAATTAGPPARELFREVTPAPAWLRVVGVLGLVAAVLLIVDAALIDPASFQGGGLVAAVVATIVLLAIGALALTVRIVVTVDESQLTLALSPVVRVRFARSDVDSAKPVKLAARDYGGAGYRVLPGGKRGLLFTSGSGVAIVRRSTRISYAVRTERATELIAALYRR